MLLYEFLFILIKLFRINNLEISSILKLKNRRYKMLLNNKVWSILRNIMIKNDLILYLFINLFLNEYIKI